MMSNLATVTPEESSFGEQLKAARRAEIKRLREAIEGLSPSERQYLGYPALDQNMATLTVIRDSNVNDRYTGGRPTKQQWADQIEQRRAKRIQDRAAAKRREEEENKQKAIDRVNRRLENAQMIIDMKEQKLRDREAKRNAPKEPKVKYKPPGEMHLKELDPKVFVPIIGKPNADGNTPVRLDWKTVVLVKPGKDIQKTIATYQKLLNIKS